MTENQKNTIDFEAEDFEAIEQAVLESERGRWFLAEYASRNRRAETTSLLRSLTKLEKAIGNELQYINNSTEGYQSHHKIASELNILIRAIGFSDESDIDPIDNLAHQMASNAFSLARFVDIIRDRIDELKLIGIPSDAVNKIGQATEEIITLTAKQSQLSRQVEALAKIITYIQNRLENAKPSGDQAGSDDLSSSLSVAAFNHLRKKIAELDSDD